MRNELLKKLLAWPVFFTTLITLSVPVSADVRTENIELFLVIDKSKSMVEEISDVTDYISRAFLEDFLINGDRLVVIQFYGKADLVYDGIIGKENRQTLIEDIRRISANGRFTDIGNALDVLNSTVETGRQLFERQYFILLTDGKQEAPHDSPYYSPDGSFNHRFLDITKTIQKKGWKIVILGLGKETLVEELSDELLSTYLEIDFAENIGDQLKSSELLGRIISGNLSFGNGRLNFQLTSEGYQKSRTVIIEQILYQLPSDNLELLETPYILEIQEEQTIDVSIELTDIIQSSLRSRNATGNLLFKFSGDTPFIPAFFESVAYDSEVSAEIDENYDKIQGQNGNKGFNWLIVLIIIIVAAVITAGILIKNSLMHRDDDDKQEKNEISGDN